MKKCNNCGTYIEDDCHYCTECGTMAVDKSTFTYNNRTYNEPSLYNYKPSSGEVNVKYSKLVKNIDATFAIGVGVAVAAVVLLLWITFGI